MRLATVAGLASLWGCGPPTPSCWTYFDIQTWTVAPDTGTIGCSACTVVPDAFDTANCHTQSFRVSSTVSGCRRSGADLVCRGDATCEPGCR